MENETYEIRRGTIVHKTKPPLDVRIVAYYLYAESFLFLVLSFFIGTGLAEPQPHRVLLGSVTVASGLADSLDKLATGIVSLFCAWGLMRRARFAWWFSLISSVYGSTDAVLVLPEHQIGVAISVGIDVVLVAWLWFRRELYGVHLAASRPKK